MQPKSQVPPAPSSLTISDIYYVLFKHKWMILILSALGIGAAVTMYFVMPPPYTSEALLLIRYVQDTPVPSGGAQEAPIKQTDQGGEGILDSEAKILTSLDVTGEAAEKVGLEKILGKKAGTTNRELAAIFLRR